MARVIAGRYELGEQIGRGGMATVWRGRDTVLERDVALKQVVATDDVAIERAVREAQLAARLNDPHVVAVYDLVTEGAQNWLVMEHVDGTSLAERVADLGALDRREVAGIGADVAEALAAAHTAHVVHRDVKPSNVLLPIDGPAKLSDFGIARGEGDDVLTSTGLVTGSPAYLAPEVAAGQRATPASDVWSLGATLLHAATGHPPFDGSDHVMGTLYKIVHEPPPRLDGDDVLAQVVAAALQHDPAARPSAAEVADRLATFTDDPHATQPISAVSAVSAVSATQPMSAVSATQHLAPAVAPDPRRNRVAAGVAAVGVLAAILLWATTRDDEPTAAPDASPTTASPVAESSPEPSADSPTASAMEDFAREFVSLADDDPKDAFTLLSPEYQRASGGEKGFRDFWDRVDDATIQTIAADPDSLTVVYTYRYTFELDDKPGKGKGRDDRDEEKRTETVRLQLRTDPNGYRITGADSP